MNILLTKTYFKDDLDYMKSGLVADDIHFIDPGKYDEDTLINAIKTDKIEVLLGDVFTAAILNAAQDLKLIQIPWTGVDRVNFSLLNGYDIKICNSHSNSLIVAEHAVSLALSLLRMLPYHDRKLRVGNWCRPSQNGNNDFYPPVSLVGQSVGFIGYGAIAKDIRRLLSGFNCKYYAVVNNIQKHNADDFEWLGNQDEINALATKAKIIFVAAALTPQTTGIVGKDFLEAMGEDGYIINISRGQLIDEEAIYLALKNNTIAGAALDTWYQYPKGGQDATLPSKYNFQELDNVIMSPHRAGFLKDKMPHLDDAVTNINNLYNGKPLINIINKQNSY